MLSGVGSGALVAVSALASFVTTWPKWLSLAIEPASLLLIPGVFFSMVYSRSHDYVYDRILHGAYWFYVVVLYVALWVWDRGTTRRGRSVGRGRV